MKVGLYEIMRTEVIADCYAGIDCDQVVPMFKSHCDGDMGSDTHKTDIVIKLKDLPPGAVITVSYPECPECDCPREDKFESLSGARLKIVGHKEKCTCGFDWEKWVLDRYS